MKGWKVKLRDKQKKQKRDTTKNRGRKGVERGREREILTNQRKLKEGKMEKEEKTRQRNKIPDVHRGREMKERRGEAKE